MTNAENTGREIVIALVNAVDGTDAEFNEWYTNEHLPQVVALPGFISAQRYALPEALAGSSPYRYATVYEVESAPAALNQMFTAELGSSATLDVQQMFVGGFAPLGDPITPA